MRPMNKPRLNPFVTAIRHLPRGERGALGRLILGTGLGLAVSAAAFALDAPPAAAKATPAAGAASATQTTDVGGLQSVVVTARKSSEQLLDVPISISTLSAGDMQQQGLLNMRDYFTQVPGLSYDDDSVGRTYIALRGITTSAFSNPTMAVTIGDAPFGSSTSSGGGGLLFPDIDPSELQQIEVLRGPQGTLYGAASLGGLIRFVPAAPNTSRLSGHVEVDGSTLAHGGNGWGTRASINVPVVENKFALRVSVFDRKDPGYVDDPEHGRTDYNTTDVKGGRVAAVWNATDAVTVSASALTQKTHGNGGVAENVGSAYGNYTVTGTLPGVGAYDRNLNFFDLSVEADLNWATLTSTTSFSKIDYTGSQNLTQIFGMFGSIIYGDSNVGVHYDIPSTVNKLTQEVRLDSTPGNHPIDWRLGAFYTRELTTDDASAKFVDPTTGADKGYDLLYSSGDSASFREKAVFGSVTYHVNKQFDVQVGARDSIDKQTYTALADGVLNGGATADSGKSRASAFTYMLTPRYEFSRDLMAYATLSTGYRPGGVNTSIAGAIPLTYGSDRVTNSELGLKGEFFDHQLSISTAIYHISWKNIQLTATDPDSSFSYITNSAAAKSDGFEGTLAWSPVKDLTFTGNLGLTRAVLSEDAPSIAIYGLKGDRLPYSAKTTASLGVVKEFGLAGGWKGHVGATGAYVGDRMMDFESDSSVERLRVPGYSTLDVNAGVKNATWEVNAYVKNVTDRHGLLGKSYNNPNSPSTDNLVDNPIRPRAIGVSVGTSF